MIDVVFFFTLRARAINLLRASSMGQTFPTPDDTMGHQQRGAWEIQWIYFILAVSNLSVLTISSIDFPQALHSFQEYTTQLVILPLPWQAKELRSIRRT